MNAFSSDRHEWIKREILERIGASRFRTWFGDATEFRLHATGLDLLVPSEFAGSWIAKNYMEHLVAATTSVLGSERQSEVRILQRNGAAAAPIQGTPPEPVEPAGKPRSAGRAATAGLAALRGDLDSFVVGPSNRLAFAAATSVVQTAGMASKLLVLHGGCGLGKTHLLHGIANSFRRVHPTLECRYVSGEAFTNEYIAAVRASGPVDVFRARYRRVDVLIVDDIHFLANKRATQEEFLHTFNAIDAVGKAVIVSSDRHPRTISSLSEPLMNRLVAGTIIQIDPPDFTTRCEILRRRAATLGLSLREEIVALIAERIKRNVRELEGALYTLNALATLKHEPLTPELVRRALDEMSIRSQKTPDLDTIVSVCAGHFGVTREQINSRSRDRTVVLGRSVAMWLARRHTNMSFPEIGREMGKKNHSTVLMATQRVEKLVRDDAQVDWRGHNGERQTRLRSVVEVLEARLTGNADPA